MTVRRLVLCALVVLATLVSAVATTSAASRLNPNAAAMHCAAGQPLTEAYGAADLAALTRYVPCVTKTERTQEHLPYTQSASLSRGLGGALKQLIAGHGLSTAVAQTGALIGKLTARFCPAGEHARSEFAAGDTSPPPATPTYVASLLGQVFDEHDRIGALPKVTFAVAVQPGLLLRDHDSRGAAFLMLAVTCS